MLLANFNRKEHLRHRAVSLRQHGFLVVHEIQSSPTSLLNFGGKLHLTDTKSELLQCHEPPGQLEPPSTYDCTVLDDAVIVHCLPTTSYSTAPSMNTQTEDVVWDTYVRDGLKESTRGKREKGVHRKVTGETKLPGKWIFLHDPINKRNCLPF